MITTSEENAVKLSTTKKDFYQIWNELLETAGKISERWDPSSTNESDPGIVLLKVLTAIADKLNFEIDANTLEAFMPSAAQEESMRKLTEMMGYNMKYYQSATTEVQISYNTYNHSLIDNEVIIDKFTNIKNNEDTINYITTREIRLNKEQTSKTVSAMEGELIECESDDSNIISIRQLDDNFRYYLPETQVAENGIFVSNIDDNLEDDSWSKVDNLNILPARTKAYKFGYDSRRRLPYIQFPSDINAIIEDGLKIKYVRTAGVNGNISARTLNKLTKPASWAAATSEGNSEDYYNVDYYTATNITAASNGRNVESINDAYNSYKKVIGTFDTLVTCRDYMNKIYNLMLDNSTPIVSNVIVSDIKDDINKAIVLCTFDNYGIAYKNMSKSLDISKAVEHDGAWFINPTTGGSDEVRMAAYQQDTLFKNLTTGNYVKATYYASNNTYDWINIDPNSITHFDLILYPFRTVYGLNSKLEYTKSFKYDDSNNPEILNDLENTKMVSHNICTPNKDDIACIKNYLRLRAKITTVRKVNKLEQDIILNNVYSKLFENFNMRKIDFGQELNYDTILETITKADPRIKSVGLEEPELFTKYCLVNGEEYEAPTSNLEAMSDPSRQNQILAGKKYYNKTVLNNVLAGRVPLFNYDENFKPDYTEIAYPESEESGTVNYNGIYPEYGREISKLEPRFEIHSSTGIDKNGLETVNYMPSLTLQDNEVIQFRFPNLKTVKTYPAYVNYYLHLENSKSTAGIGATMYTLDKYLETTEPASESSESIWTRLANEEFLPQQPSPKDWRASSGEAPQTVLEELRQKYKKVFTKNENGVWEVNTANYDETKEPYRYFEITEENLAAWKSFITKRNAEYEKDGERAHIDNIYLSLGVDLSRNVGKLVSEYHEKYKVLDVLSSIPASASKFDKIFVPETHSTELTPAQSPSGGWYTKDGLGRNAVLSDIAKDEEYQLKPGDYLLINYTSSNTNDAGEEIKTKINEVYNHGEIIKPNFALVDSAKYRTVHSYSKNEGFDFVGTGVSQPDGLFTLGADEQIEIRDYVVVELDELATNIYWNRRDEDSLTVPGDVSGKIVFSYNEDLVYKDTWEPVPVGTEFDQNTMIYTSYTLKEGERLYYTTKDKVDMVAYGSGTKITRSEYTPEIFKYKKDAYISPDEISTKGLTAAIPWRSYNFGSSGGKNRKLVATEFKYVNLMAGDILSTVVPADTPDSAHPETISDIHMPIINNEWQKIETASYIVDEVNHSLQSIDIANKYWEIRSKLEINASPVTVQTLHRLDATNGSFAKDCLKVYFRDATNHTDAGSITLENQKIDADWRNLSFKTNSLLQHSTADYIDTVIKTFDENGQELDDKAPLQLKIFEVNDVIAGNSPANIGNFGDGNFTKISFIGFKEESGISSSFTTLNLNIPEYRFGLIMLYYLPLTDNQSTTENAYLMLDGGESALKIYNYSYEESGVTGNWWNGYQSGNKYYLRPGINVIELPNGGHTLEFYPDAQSHDTIIFSNLDIVYQDTDTYQTINPKLQYQKISTDPAATVTDQILADINNIDYNHQFYYNAIITNSADIDLNLSDEDDTLLNPYILYEYNNINNKFVISEIDADYLSDHVVIAKSSKL